MRQRTGNTSRRPAGLAGGAFACLAVLFLSGAATAQQADFVSPEIEMGEAGIFCPIPSAGSEIAPNTESGYINLIDGDYRVDLHSRIVPTHLGLSFGIRIRLAPGTGGGPYYIVVTHPPVGERGVTREEWQANLGPDFGVRLFEFEFDREMQTGPWVFEVTDGETTYLRQSFEVVAPHLAPAAIDLCFGDRMMS